MFCNFTSLRAVTFKVAECTDFENRTIPREWELEKLALIINSEPARKRAGFNPGFASAATEDDALTSDDEE